MEEYPSLAEGIGLENRQAVKTVRGFESLFLLFYLSIGVELHVHFIWFFISCRGIMNRKCTTGQKAVSIPLSAGVRFTLLLPILFYMKMNWKLETACKAETVGSIPRHLHHLLPAYLFTGA